MLNVYLPFTWSCPHSFVHVFKQMNDDNFQEDFEKVFSIVEGEQKLADETQIPLPKPKPGKMEKLSRQDSKVKKYEMAAEPRHRGGSKTKVKKYQVAANPPCLPGSAY